MIKGDNRVLTENFISLALTQAISYIIPLISLPYLARVLSAEKFGLVFWAQATIQYFIILTDFGFGLSAVREISIYRDDRDKINQIFNSIMIVKICLILLSFIILNLFIFLVPKFYNEWLLFYLTFFMVIGNALYPVWFFQGIEHMKYITFLNILAKSLFLILIFIFIKQPSDYVLVAILNSLGAITAGIIGIYIANKRFGLKLLIPNKEEIIHQFKYSSEFFMSRIASVGYTNTNAFILGLVSNPLMVAYYTAAEKIYVAMFGLTAPFSQALYPFVAKKQDIRKYKQIFFSAVIFVILMSSFMFIFSKLTITLFYGSKLIPAYKILRIFCFTVLFSFISAMIGYPLLAAMGHTKEANFSIVFASVIHILILLFLMVFGKINIYILAYLTILAEALIVIYRVYYIKKYNLWSETR